MPEENNKPKNVHKEQDNFGNQPMWASNQRIMGMPEDDEIDLAELVAVLFHHKRLIIMLTILCALLAPAYTIRTL